MLASRPISCTVTWWRGYIYAARPSVYGLRSFGGFGSLPGGTVSESLQRPVRSWMRTSPPPRFPTISLARLSRFALVFRLSARRRHS